MQRKIIALRMQRQCLLTPVDEREYDALYRSARCRADADWLIGMNATRAYTLRYNVLLSVGRVQTPTLNLIVKRDLEIENCTVVCSDGSVTLN